MKNGLYVVATPIGNLGDISRRAIETLQEADVIACEDSRVTKKLFSLLGISLNKTFISLHDHNEEEQSAKIIAAVEEGKAVAQVSDAGSPLISDPGYKLVKKCREAGIFVTTIPGCCALISALQISGLPSHSFLFAGFIPNKEKARLDLFKKYKDLDSTLIFYETANRICKTLAAAETVFGDREMAVAREITKVYEECVNGNSAQLIAHFQDSEPKGEMVFMVSPASEKTQNLEDMDELLREKLKKNSLKIAVKELSELYGFNKNELYDMALRIKNEE